MISFAVSQHTGDVDKIMIDKSLVGKLSGDAASEGETLHMCIKTVNVT